MGIKSSERVVDAIAGAVRTCARHRLEMMLLLAGGGTRVSRVVVGAELDARVAADLLVALSIPDSLNAYAGGVIVVEGGRIVIAGGRLVAGAAEPGAREGWRARLDEVSARTGAVAVSVSESDGVVRVAAPGSPTRTVHPNELAVLLDDLGASGAKGRHAT